MANPTPYSPGFSFSDWQTSNPADPLPAPRLDDELADISLSVNQTIGALGQIRRSDGALANQSVGPSQLSPTLSIGFTNRGNWLSGVNYAAGDGVVLAGVFYSASVAHLSDMTNQPPNSSYWNVLFSVSDIAIAGALSMPVSSFVGDGTTVSFNLSYTPLSTANMFISVGGVIQTTDQYGVVGTTLTFVTPPMNGYVIEARAFATTTSLIAPSDGSVTTSTIQDGAVTAPKLATGAVTTVKILDGNVTPAKLSSATLQSFAGLTLSSGDLLYATGAGALQRLAVGTTGQVLAVSSGLPAWQNNTADVAGQIHAATVKAAIDDTDEMGLADSAASYVLKRFSLLNLVTSIFKSTRTIANGVFDETTFFLKNAGGFTSRFVATANSANRLYTLPNASGTVALTSDVVFTKSYVSAQQTLTLGGSLTLAHGLGIAPKLVTAELVCVTADLGYSVGDRVIINPHFQQTANASYGQSVVPDNTNLNVRYGSASPLYQLLRADTGAGGSITSITNWKLVLRAYA